MSKVQTISSTKANAIGMGKVNLPQKHVKKICACPVISFSSLTTAVSLDIITK